MLKKAFRFFNTGLRNAEVRDRIYRILGIASLLVMVGGSVVLVLAVIYRLQVLIVAFSGVLSMSAAFYLFIKLWPNDISKEETDRRVKRVQGAIKQKQPEREMTPLEMRRQRERAQRMIREKAAPALAKAIRGILRQDELERRAKRR